MLYTMPFQHHINCIEYNALHSELTHQWSGVILLKSSFPILSSSENPKVFLLREQSMMELQSC
jgi:hypothetical protein